MLGIAILAVFLVIGIRTLEWMSQSVPLPRHRDYGPRFFTGDDEDSPPLGEQSGKPGKDEL
jgi:hypothetical protein